MDGSFDIIALWSHFHFFWVDYRLATPNSTDGADVRK